MRAHLNKAHPICTKLAPAELDDPSGLRREAKTPKDAYGKGLWFVSLSSIYLLRGDRVGHDLSQAMSGAKSKSGAA